MAAGTGARTAAGPGTYALLAAGMAVFGSGTPISKMVTRAFPVYLASGLRMALAVAVLVPLLAARRRRDREPGGVLPALDRRDWLVLAGIAVGGMFLFSMFMLSGMRSIPGAVGGVVMATTPAVTAAGSVLFLRDRLDRWKAVGIGCAVAGVVAVNLGGARGEGGGTNLWLGTLLVFGAVCGEAAYTLLGKRLTADLSPLAVAALAGLLAAGLFAPFAAWQAAGFDWAGPSAAEWAALAWWG